MSEIKNVPLGETNPWEIIDYSLFRKFGTLVSKNYTTGLFFKTLSYTTASKYYSSFTDNTGKVINVFLF
jgi:hypothetical protein